MTQVNTGYMPRVHQLEIHQNLRRFNVLVCHRRFGKALALNTPIPMADGSWSTMGAVESGDTILGSDGLPIRVFAAHAVMEGRPCYEVEFSSGEKIVADAEHLWLTTRKKDRHNPVRLPEGRLNRPRPAAVRTTKEIAGTLRSRGENNHRVPLAGPAAYPGQALSIDPYLLGLWLGDGHSWHAQFTTADKELAEAFSDTWEVKPSNTQNAGMATTYSIVGGLLAALKKSKLIANKHIPEEYQRGSVRQRLALLQGLMDTDGTINKAGNYCEIIQKSPSLAVGLERLILSLGMIARVSVKTVGDGKYFRIVFRPMVNVFRLSAKADKWHPPPEQNRWQSIVAAKRVKSVPVRCLTVAAEDSLFLVGNHFIPTHNTVACINQLVHECLRNKRQEPRYHYFAPLFRQAKQAAWDYLKMYTREIPGMKPNEQELRVDLPGNRRIQLFGADNYDSIRGIYSDGAILDEYADMPPPLWSEVLRPALADREGMAIFIGTPRGRNAFFEMYQHAQKTDNDWFHAIYRASETEILPEEELREAAMHMTEDQYAQEFECSFEAAIPGSYHGKIIVEIEKEGRICSVPYDSALPVETWWDLGIGDPTAIWFLQRAGGGEYRFIDYFEAKGMGLTKPDGGLAKVLDDKQLEFDWIYDKHIWPHDGAARDMTTGDKREDVFRALGFNVEVQPKESFEEGIDAARRTLHMSWFDEERCKDGIEALRQYRMEYDDKKQVLAKNARHDWTCHAADAFRIGALHQSPGRRYFKPIEYPAHHPSYGVV